MPLMMIAICLVLLLFGMIIGRGLAKFSLVACAVAGAAGVAALTIFLIVASGSGCGGSGCTGAQFAVLLVGPIGIGGAGMLLASGYVLARRRLLRSGSPALRRGLSVLFWGAPTSAALVLAGLGIRQHVEDVRSFTTAVSASAGAPR